MKRIILIFLFLFLLIPVYCQESSRNADTLRKDALNVYMESSDYLRKEIPYVNYVRDIKDAAVYIISSSQKTGSGGTEFTYFLVGQNENAGMADTLSFVTSPDETMEETRQKEVNTLKMGLMRYVAKTPLSKFMKITFTEPLSETVSTDKWDSWVFSTSLNGFLELRIAKGLSINFGGSASMIHDQLGLVKEDIPVDQILLQRKELATQFEYFTSFGFTYTFGSIYNNVVNPRFGSTSGGGMTSYYCKSV